MKHSGRRSKVLPALALTVVAVSACGKKPAPPAAPVAEAPPPAPAPRAEPPRENGDRAAEEARREMARKRSLLEEMSFFDFDKAEIRPDARRVLDAKLPILREDGQIRLRIEGHADERGSTEYNQVLSVRRANAVRDYLTDGGLDAARFDIVGYGEERPLAQGHDESAWQRNRRAEFRITAGLTATDR